MPYCTCNHTASKMQLFVVVEGSAISELNDAGACSILPGFEVSSCATCTWQAYCSRDLLLSSGRTDCALEWCSFNTYLFKVRNSELRHLPPLRQPCTNWRKCICCIILPHLAALNNPKCLDAARPVTAIRSMLRQ